MMEAPVLPASEERAAEAVDVTDALLEAVIVERDQALVDLESWRVAMTAFIAELILHEMPISKVGVLVDKVQSDMQHHLQYGTPVRHPGALAAAADLVGKVEHAAEWRRMAWANDKKKRAAGYEPPPPPASRRKGRSE